MVKYIKLLLLSITFFSCSDDTPNIEEEILKVALTEFQKKEKWKEYSVDRVDEISPNKWRVVISRKPLTFGDHRMIIIENKKVISYH
jgi:hypothetical protein